MLKDTKCVVSVERGWLKEYFLSSFAMSATVGWSDDMLFERVAIFPVLVRCRVDFVLMVGVCSSGGCEDVTRVGGSVTIFGGLDSLTRLGLEGSVTGFVVVVWLSLYHSACPLACVLGL